MLATTCKFLTNSMTRLSTGEDEADCYVILKAGNDKNIFYDNIPVTVSLQDKCNAWLT